MAQYLSRADCGCQTPTCISNCKLVSQGLPPDHFQALAHTLIDADTIRYANVLPKSPALTHVLNAEGADRMWGSQGIKDNEAHTGDYYYSPGFKHQIAIKTRKENRINPKDLWGPTSRPPDSN
jgi:hypothetical protein